MFELNIYQSENKTVICCVKVRYVHVHGSILFDRRFLKKLGNGKVHRMGTDLRKGGVAILVAHKVFTTPILTETGRVPLKKPVCTNFEKVLLP